MSESAPGGLDGADWEILGKVEGVHCGRGRDLRDRLAGLVLWN